MKNINAVFKKQIKETLKNTPVLIQFSMFPLLTVIMENAVKIEGMPEHFFAKLFSVMFAGMCPLICMSSIISEEKEKNTLRVLMMSNVKPFEYLAGTGAYIFICCLAGTAVFAACGGYSGAGLVTYVSAMSAGIILSMLIGAVIGIGAGSQMSAASVSATLMIIFSFTPMLSMFNETIKKFSGIIFTNQLNEIINNIGNSPVEAKSVLVIAASFFAAAGAFGFIYKKAGLN